MNQESRSTIRRWWPTRVLAGGLVTLALGVGFAGGRATLEATEPTLAPPAITAAAPLPSPASVPSYSAIVDRVAPAVATIRVERQAEAVMTDLPAPLRDFFGPSLRGNRGPAPRERGLGSGVVIRGDGYILTNHHVVAGAEAITVEFADGRSLAATVVGSDPPSDLAVLQVKAADLPTVPFGNSDDVRVGDVVLAFGNPMGVGQTVTMGIVSAKGRATGVGDGSYEDFLQTDAPINRGNSGGALVDMNGQLVGINAQILSPSGGNIGLGFAIPAGMAKAVATQLIDGGVVHRGRLGVTVQTLTSDLAAGMGLSDTRGALVSQVEPDSPAANAGLKAGDVILSMDGRAVADSNALRNVVAASRPGTRIALGIWREGDRQDVTATLAERASATNARRGTDGDSSRRDSSGYGLTVQPLTPDLANQVAVPPATRGVVVMQVAPDSPAAGAGLQPGDVIMRVNGREVATAAALRSALDAASGDTPSVVLVMRDGATMFVALRARR